MSLLEETVAKIEKQDMDSREHAKEHILNLTMRRQIGSHPHIHNRHFRPSILRKHIDARAPVHEIIDHLRCDGLRIRADPLFHDSVVARHQDDILPRSGSII